MDARDSDLGLPDFGKISRRIPKLDEEKIENMVGSTSVLEFRKQVKNQRLSRFEQLINNFNMDMAAAFTGVYNHNEPN